MEAIIAKIESHTHEVKTGRGDNEIVNCQRCFARPEKFKQHDRRQRQLRVIVGNFVRVLTTLLLRLICPICKRTFTVYPRFMLPRKRYARSDLEELSKKYLDEEKQTYRKAVTPQDMAIVYEGLPGQIDERQLSHTTLWRFISFLGSLPMTLEQAQRLIAEKTPDTSLFRNLNPIAPKKYRSIERKGVLESALKLLSAAEEFIKCFGYEIFPRLATLCRWK